MPADGIGQRHALRRGRTEVATGRRNEIARTYVGAALSEGFEELLERGFDAIDFFAHEALGDSRHLLANRLADHAVRHAVENSAHDLLDDLIADGRGRR